MIGNPVGLTVSKPTGETWRPIFMASRDSVLNSSGVAFRVTKAVLNSASVSFTVEDDVLNSSSTAFRIFN